MRKVSVYLLALVLFVGAGSLASGQAQPAGQPGDTATTTTRNVDDDDGMDWGWVGLLGLVGLMGLKRREPERVRTTANAGAR